MRREYDRIPGKPVGAGRIIQAFGIDRDGVFWVAVSGRMSWLVGGLATVLVIGIIVVSTVVLIQARQIQSEETRLHHAQALIDTTQHRLVTGWFRSCARLQLLRDDVNQRGVELYDWTRTISALPGLPASLKAATERLSQGLRYIPPTNCNAAVRDPQDYVPPVAVPYATLEPARLDRIRAGGRPNP